MPLLVRKLGFQDFVKSPSMPRGIPAPHGGDRRIEAAERTPPERPRPPRHQRREGPPPRRGRPADRFPDGRDAAGEPIPPGSNRVGPLPPPDLPGERGFLELTKHRGHHRKKTFEACLNLLVGELPEAPGHRRRPLLLLPPPPRRSVASLPSGSPRGLSRRASSRLDVSASASATPFVTTWSSAARSTGQARRR